MAVLLTTNATVTVNDLDGRVFTHPVVDLDLLSFFSIRDIAKSDDLQAHIDSGDVVIKFQSHTISDLSAQLDPEAAVITEYFFPVTVNAKKNLGIPHAKIGTDNQDDGYTLIPIYFYWPYSNIQKIVVLGFTDSVGGGPSLDIDLWSTYGCSGEAYNQHQSSDTTSTYDTGTLGTNFEIDVTSLFSQADVNDIGGLKVQNNDPSKDPIMIAGVKVTTK